MSSPHVEVKPTASAPGGVPAAPGRILILGAGPTGLGAAYRLRELGHDDFFMYDRNPYLGGLAHSFVDEAGFTWDIGGHVMFSHYTYYNEVFDRLMGDEYTLNDRESWVRIMGRWVPYPFQNNIRHLPPEVTFECLSGLIKAQNGKGKIPGPAAAKNFGEFIDAVFGEGIARHFMRPYNFKVWAYPPEMMNKQWIGERVAVLDVDRALRNVVLGTDDFGWGPNNRFKFPLRGGTGEFYRRFDRVIGGTYRLNTRCESIDVDRRVVTFADGTTDRYDTLISTIPLDILCRDVLVSEQGSIPDRIRETACRLRHSSGYMVGIGIRRPCPSTKSWMYFPDPDCPFYRVTYLSNYSPHMTPEPYVTDESGRRQGRYYSLLCEISASEFKPVDESAVVEDTIRGLINAGLLTEEERADIVSVWTYKAAYSYPTPTVDRDEILSEVIPWLEARGLYSRGRFGMWKYEVANTDHSLMQGVELINRLLLGEAETTTGVVYRVTEDGRNAADHERSAVAGSGEKRLSRP
ncbi:MAG: FAD-dependent oxidoreductase [Phycisphaeraceae bacterium]|nr:FAD-dependent oxidoreductase [Phycisphaerae bacterium]MBX3393552.1 FAD-dependent oxidoreductase [Phycisphaeraceae bacterium]HRJ50132.1 FAD-dependent oxidoreductase [Phycisphaerales bacterium]